MGVRVGIETAAGGTGIAGGGTGSEVSESAPAAMTAHGSTNSRRHAMASPARGLARCGTIAP